MCIILVQLTLDVLGAWYCDMESIISVSDFLLTLCANSYPSAQYFSLLYMIVLGNMSVLSLHSSSSRGRTIASKDSSAGVFPVDGCLLIMLNLIFPLKFDVWTTAVLFDMHNFSMISCCILCVAVAVIATNTTWGIIDFSFESLR